MLSDQRVNCPDVHKLTTHELKNWKMLGTPSVSEQSFGALELFEDKLRDVRLVKDGNHMRE